MKPRKTRRLKYCVRKCRKNGKTKCRVKCRRKTRTKRSRRHGGNPLIIL